MTSRDTTAAPAALEPMELLPEVRNDMSHQLRATWVVTRRELLRLKQDKARMVTMLLQPLLFIFVMGTGLGSIVDTGGGTDFRTFLFPGVLATSVLFTAAFAGISLVWDREFGFLREMMVAPISRASIIWGKCLGGAIVATTSAPSRRTRCTNTEVASSMPSSRNAAVSVAEASASATPSSKRSGSWSRRARDPR